MANVGIQTSWSLVAFASITGKCQIGTFQHKGDYFKSLIFTNSKGSRTFVGFSSNLGELSAESVSRLKDELQVVLLESGRYKLCRKGGNNWEDVDL